MTIQQLGATSCALGPHPFDSLDAKHLCNGSSFVSATIYAPKTNEQETLLPSIVIVGGLACAEQAMGAWGPFYASHGIVAMTIGTPAPWGDGNKKRCNALLDASKALQLEHTREGSTLQGRLDASRRALQGYSLGGGGARLAAVEDPTLKCIVILCPHGGPPSAVVPTLTICAEKDDLANAQKHSWRTFHKMTAPRMIMEVSGGDHYVANGPAGGTEKEAFKGAKVQRNFFCWLLCCGAYIPDKGKEGFMHAITGQAKDESPHGVIGGLALAWLQLFLVGDETARAKLLACRPSIASGFESHGLEKAISMERDV